MLECARRSQKYDGIEGGCTPVTLYTLEVIDDGDAQARDGVEDCEHHDVRREMSKQSLHIGTSMGQ